MSLLWQYYNDTLILATSYLTLSSDIVKDGGIEVDGGYLNFMDSGGNIVESTFFADPLPSMLVR